MNFVVLLLSRNNSPMRFHYNKLAEEINDFLPKGLYKHTVQENSCFVLELLCRKDFQFAYIFMLNCH